MIWMGKPAVTIELSAAERHEPQASPHARKTGPARARRAWIVLAAAAGFENKATHFEVDANASTLGKWRRRLAKDRLVLLCHKRLYDSEPIVYGRGLMFVEADRGLFTRHARERIAPWRLCRGSDALTRARRPGNAVLLLL